MTLETPAAPGPTESGIVSEESVPVYDPLKLMELADEAGEIVAQRFINEYLALLPHRQDRILAKLALGDDETAMDAVLSLKTTSAMVGAVRLSGYCQHLQDQMALGNVAEAAKGAAELGVLISDLVRAVNGAS